MDECTRLWNNKIRGELREGHLSARHYIMEMIDEHYQNGGSKQELELWMEEYKTYMELLHNTMIGSSNVNKRLQKMQKHPIQYRIKNNIKGLIHKGAKILITFPILKEIVERKRYPIKI